MNWVYDDGGRNAAGFRGKAGDCVARSIAIATRLPYRHVYALLDEQAQREPDQRPALFGAERRLPSNLSTGAGAAGLALGSDHENRGWMPGASKGGRATRGPVDRPLFEA